MAIAHIWSNVRLTKRAVPLINLSVPQHLTTCAIFGQSHSPLAIGLGLVLELGLGLHNWLNPKLIAFISVIFVLIVFDCII